MNKMAHESNPAETVPRVSVFLLERYHIGEVGPEEKRLVEQALAESPSLTDSLAKLDDGDRYFREKFPHEVFLPKKHNTIAYNRLPDKSGKRRFGLRNVRVSRLTGWAVCAAAVALIAFIPWFILKNSARTDYTEYGDRIKGAVGNGYSAELSVYLKDERGRAADSKLEDQAVVRAGNTIQLAYRLTEDGSGEKYGAIFSIDGRSSITMHYPYAYDQSTRLVTGNAVPLAEAYTLDDAPSYEMFFFVISDNPLNVPDILIAAERIAPLIAKKPREALQQGIAAFKNRELQIITLRKE